MCTTVGKKKFLKDFRALYGLIEIQLVAEADMLTTVSPLPCLFHVQKRCYCLLAIRNANTNVLMFQRLSLSIFVCIILKTREVMSVLLIGILSNEGDGVAVS